MFDDALPVWAEIGVDAPGLGFREHLTLEGLPAPVAFKRMRVQARQIYVFSHAQMLGFPGGIDLAVRGYDFVMAHGRRGDGGWVRMLGPQGGALDPAADLYDIAFVMLAMGWFARATGDQAPLRLAKTTLEWVRANMAVAGGGYHNALPVEPGYRGQNPHMHLLEASLALFEASGDAIYAELAHELVALFRSHFHHQDSGTLGEFYDELLQPAPAEHGTHVEPGHHYEWVWLLEQYARLFGGPVEAESQRLYSFAETFGRDTAGVPVLDVIGRDGGLRHGTARLWPQTEALKAHATMTRRGIDVQPRFEADLTCLLDRYLSGCPRGMWQDQFAPNGGGNIATKIPASSLYHIFVAYNDLRQLVGATAAA